MWTDEQKELYDDLLDEVYEMFWAFEEREATDEEMEDLEQEALYALRNNVDDPTLQLDPEYGDRVYPEGFDYE